MQNQLTVDKTKLSQAFAYIEQMWPRLTKDQSIDDGTLLGLPHPYVVPSAEITNGFSFQEMYYWDSYFVAQGLLASGHDELAAGMLEDLLFLYRRFHVVPNASRTYHTSRSQPPLLTSYIFDIYEKQQKDEDWLRERIYVAEREYKHVWTNHEHPHWRNVFEGLSRFYDINVLDHLAEAESGWDMTTRFKGKCLSHIPICLNSLLYKYESDFARAADILGNPDDAALWRERMQHRADNVTKYLWNDEAGFFFDFDYITQQPSDVWSLASFYALWSGLATQNQAGRMVENLPHFMHRGGLTTTRNSDEYNGDTPTQWAYPNGWAPLHWLVTKGLQNYGFNNEADLVARSWICNGIEHFEKNGVFREAYNVIDPDLPPRPGVYPPQIGFGWTNGVFVSLAKQFLSEDELELV